MSVLLNKNVRALIAKQYDEANHWACEQSDEVFQTYNDLRIEAAQLCGSIQKNAKVFMVLSGPDPYGSTFEMVQDVQRTRQLRVWEHNGDMPNDHPLAKRASGPGFAFTYNTCYRFVHDFLGHFLSNGAQDVEGEIAAYLSERRFYSALAQPALFTESVGQLCWYEANGKFSTQKACVLPIWHLLKETL